MKCPVCGDEWSVYLRVQERHSGTASLTDDGQSDLDASDIEYEDTLVEVPACENGCQIAGWVENGLWVVRPSTHRDNQHWARARLRAYMHESDLASHAFYSDPIYADIQQALRTLQSCIAKLPVSKEYKA